MSLLIDALKQAEAARAQAQSTTTPPASEGIELEPLAATTTSSAASESSNHVPSARVPVAEPRRTRPSTPASNVPNDAARELFEIKRQAPNRLPIIFAAVAAFLFLGGAGYVWWAMQPHSSLIAPAFNSAAPSSSQTPVAPPGTAATPPMATNEATPPSVPNTQVTPPVKAPVSSDAPPQRRERRDRFRTGAPTSKRPQSTIVLDETQPPVRNSAIVDTRDASGIQAAYAAFLAGNYTLARQRYQEVLRQDPRSVDAMNALGLIAWRSGQPDVAERMFRAAVQADPKDVTAMSQLTLLYAEGDPTAAEGRLRNLIASQPAAGASYYALGSLLARQERWNEAQQALFQAYTLDSENPDVLFNLAVCLEHLAQPVVARQFYERALQAATRRPAGFDKSVVQSRVQALGSR